MDAGTLNCPQCGAAVSKEATQCQYCHALLETMACPQCMGMMFVGSKFCPHCGAAAQAISQGDATKVVCPLCQGPLQRMTVVNTPVDECLKCGGLWMTENCFEHLCAVAEKQPQLSTFKRPERAVLNAGRVKYLKCPQCQGLMNRTNYAGTSGVVINTCKPHGVWLHRDNMRQIVDFIHSGGLQLAPKAAPPPPADPFLMGDYSDNSMTSLLKHLLIR